MSHFDSHFNPDCAKLQSSGGTETLGNLWSFFFPVCELFYMDAYLLKTPDEIRRKLLHRYTKVCFGDNLMYKII